jgi:hypothetical protein
MVTSLMIAAFAAFASVETPAEADAMLAQLSKIRLDKKQIYSVRDITLTRDALSISLNRGALAFTEALDGKVTGAVFLGNGDILAIPPNAGEKQQLFRYTKSALLNEHFETAIFRFTDGTFDEILKQYRTHAEEPVDAEVTDNLLRWEAEIQRRAAFLNDRLLEDFLGNSGKPFFLAQIEASHAGWFDAIYDERRTEEIFIQQSTTLLAQPLVWASFNKRSEARDPEAFAHEDKSTFEMMAVTDDGTSVRLRSRVDGERVLQLPSSSARVIEVALDGGPTLPFLQNGDHFAAVLPEPTRSGAEISLRIAYAAEDTAPRLRPTVRTNGIAPASYRDQWIIEGFSGYALAGSDPQWLSQARRQLLEESPEGGTYESRGPVHIGLRMTQPRTTPGYVAALRNKSVWIMHMLRNVMQTNPESTAFADFVEDLRAQFRTRSISTYDFKSVAEKHHRKSLDWFFDDWVFGTGIPAYKLDYKIDPGPGGFVVSGSVSQSGVPDTFEMPVPVYADDTLLGMVTVSVDGGDFRFTTRSRPQQIHVDPKGTVLTRVAN